MGGSSHSWVRHTTSPLFCFAGRSSPCSRNHRRRALPSSITLSKTSRMASCTRRSILLQPVTGLHVSDRGGNDKLAPFCLLVSAASERWRRRSSSYSLRDPFRPSSKRSALSWCVDRLLVDQHGIDDAAHLGVAAVAGKPRHLPRRHAPTLPRQTSATMRSKPVRSTSRPSGRDLRDRFNPGRHCSSRPRRKRAALAIVQNLMGG